MAKNYRMIQQWNYWLTQDLGINLLTAENTFLSNALVEQYGKHILLIGVPEQSQLLNCSVIPNKILLTSLFNKHTYSKCIESEYYDLPIAPGSIDIVILPHLLEFIDNPHRLLTEACRIVKPEGFIIIFGFNPTSLWGLKKWWMKSKTMPWNGSFLKPKVIKHWLKLADFELFKHDMLLFRPPLLHSVWYEKLKWLDSIGKKLYAPFGGVYVLTAQAKTTALTPIKLHWKQKLAALHTPIPRPTMRDMHN
ncbi:MAG: methyltransferase domain-containing protein [Gammaproteobacteria bacterium]|nr:methyltransferase domain-containing protein [Gammaproteobacteria bacterium]